MSSDGRTPPMPTNVQGGFDGRRAVLPLGLLASKVDVALRVAEVWHLNALDDVDAAEFVRMIAGAEEGRKMIRDERLRVKGSRLA